MGQSAAVTAAGGVHGFPAMLTSFIGRAGPVREVAGRAPSAVAVDPAVRTVYVSNGDGTISIIPATP